MREWAATIKILIQRINFLKLLDGTKTLDELLILKSFDRHTAQELVDRLGCITIDELIQRYETAKKKVITSRIQRDKYETAFSNLENREDVLYSMDARKINSRIYERMEAELFGSQTSSVA